MVSGKQGNNKPIEVHMFEKFRVSCNDVVLSPDNVRSSMMEKIAAFLLANHDKALTNQVLIDVLWPDDESGNPLGALKNLIYRLRNLFKKSFGDREYIITGRGFYQWNPEIPITIDSEVFENYALEAEASIEDDIIIKSGRAAMKLYTGPYLPGLFTEYWVVSQSSHFHALYLAVAKKCIYALMRQKEYEEAKEACQEAIKVDGLDEELHIMLIRALIADNKQQLATHHYHETVRRLYDELGIKPSEELQLIYSELLTRQHEVELDIHAVHEQLLDQSWVDGPLFCEYGMFQKIYTLMTYNSGRLGFAGQLGLITLIPEDKPEYDTETYKKVVQNGMVKLRNSMERTLRTNDMVCRFSPSQFLILLTACKYEAAVTVIERIIRRLSKADPQQLLRVDYCLDEIKIN